MLNPKSTLLHIEPQDRRVWSIAEEPENFAKNLILYRLGKLSEDEFRRFRLQHGIYSERFQKDFVMVRVKVPSGVLTPEQLIRMADLAESFSIGSAHISTRQNFQLHWVSLDQVPEVLRKLAEVGLTTRESCGNTVRNVACCYLAGVCNLEAFDVTPYALATTEFFLRNPLNQTLPRKFKFNFSGCGRDCGLACIGDIGAVAEERVVDGRKERGFKVYLGGGLGPASYLGHHLEDFTPEDDFLPTCIAILRVFDRLGDREKMHRNRMRYLVHDVGFEEFRRLVLKERAIVRATLPANAKLKRLEKMVQGSNDGELPDSGDPDFKRWVMTNAVPQKQKGYYAVHVTVPGGDLSADQLRGLAEICGKHSREAEVRTTQSQNLVTHWVPAADVYNVYRALLDLRLALPGANGLTSTVGCTGATSCNLAVTNSHRLAKEVQRRLLDLGLDKDPGLEGATVKISGCPNSCGQNPMATIGFSGASIRINGGLAPAYVMFVAGRASRPAALGQILTRVPAKRVVEVVLKVIELYKREREAWEPIEAWICRVQKGLGGPDIRDSADLKRAVDAVAEIKGPDEDPDAYVDWGSTLTFIAKTARGECAA